MLIISIANFKFVAVRHLQSNLKDRAEDEYMIKIEDMTRTQKRMSDDMDLTRTRQHPTHSQSSSCHMIASKVKFPMLPARDQGQREHSTQALRLS